MHTGFWWGPEGKKPRGKPRFRWDDNIKVGFKEPRWKRWRAVVNAVIKLRVS